MRDQNSKTPSPHSSNAVASSYQVPQSLQPVIQRLNQPELKQVHQIINLSQIHQAFQHNTQALAHLAQSIDLLTQHSSSAQTRTELNQHETKVFESISSANTLSPQRTEQHNQIKQQHTVVKLSQLHTQHNTQAFVHLTKSIEQLTQYRASSQTTSHLNKHQHEAKTFASVSHANQVAPEHTEQHPQVKQQHTIAKLSQIHQVCQHNTQAFVHLTKSIEQLTQYRASSQTTSHLNKHQHEAKTFASVSHANQVAPEHTEQHPQVKQQHTIAKLSQIHQVCQHNTQAFVHLTKSIEQLTQYRASSQTTSHLNKHQHEAKTFASVSHANQVAPEHTEQDPQVKQQHTIAKLSQSYTQHNTQALAKISQCIEALPQNTGKNVMGAEAQKHNMKSSVSPSWNQLIAILGDISSLDVDGVKAPLAQINAQLPMTTTTQNALAGFSSAALRTVSRLSVMLSSLDILKAYQTYQQTPESQSHEKHEAGAQVVGKATSLAVGLGTGSMVNQLLNVLFGRLATVPRLIVSGLSAVGAGRLIGSSAEDAGQWAYRSVTESSSEGQMSQQKSILEQAMMIGSVSLSIATLFPKTLMKGITGLGRISGVSGFLSSRLMQLKNGFTGFQSTMSILSTLFRSSFVQHIHSIKSFVQDLGVFQKVKNGFTGFQSTMRILSTLFRSSFVQHIHSIKSFVQGLGIFQKVARVMAFCAQWGALLGRALSFIRGALLALSAGIAAVSSPVLLLVAGVTALITGFALCSGGLEQIKAKLSACVEGILGFFSDIFAGIQSLLPDFGDWNLFGSDEKETPQSSQLHNVIAQEKHIRVQKESLQTAEAQVSSNMFSNTTSLTQTLAQKRPVTQQAQPPQVNIQSIQVQGMQPKNIEQDLSTTIRQAIEQYFHQQQVTQRAEYTYG